MPKKEICATALEAVRDIPDGASVLVHSFGPPQAWPTDCLLAVVDRGVKDLTVICNTPAGGPTAATVLCAKKQVRKLVCSYVGSPSIPTFFPPRARYFPPASVRALPAMGAYSFRNASWLVTSISTTANAGGFAWACNVWTAAPPIAAPATRAKASLQFECMNCPFWVWY
jgi:hypothetical protein